MKGYREGERIDRTNASYLNQRGRPALEKWVYTFESVLVQVGGGGLLQVLPCRG